MPITGAAGADIALPAEGRGRLDRDARRAAQHLGAIGLASWASNSAQQGSDTTAAAMPRAVQQVARRQRQRHLRAGGDERRLARPLGFGQHIAAARPSGSRRRRGAAPAPIAGSAPAPRARCACAAPVPSIPPSRPRRPGGTPAGWGWRAGGQMLDRLVRRPVLAEPDRIMGHDIDDAQPHQRREPDRRAAIIGEHQEGAAIGDDAAMQRPCRSSPPPCRARGCRNGGSCRRNRRA